jgi:cytochrome-b5 reductase
MENDDEEFLPTWMPPHPRKPEEWECCGSGCVPCVFDIYEQDVKNWKERLTSAEREVPTISDDCCLSPVEFRQFRLIKIQKETENTYRYTFSTPDRGSLNMKAGQHIVLR